MSDSYTSPLSVDFADLLVNTVEAVIRSQEQLDAYTRRLEEAYESTPDGELAIPPLWYTISSAAVELELSAVVKQAASAVGGEQQAKLACRTLNPLSVGLYGYQASAGLRVRLQISPRGVLPVKSTLE